MKINQKIGFIGTGVMGKSMANHLLNAGFELSVYNRTKEKTTDLVQNGAIWRSTPQEVVRNADIIITMVGFPSDVEELYLGENGIITHAKRGAIAIDMTTSSPVLALKIHELGLKEGIMTLDAPVSGGDVGAKEATLSIMVGGDLKPFDEVKPIFELLGTNIVYQGKAGSGQHTKMCNQITIASNMIGVTEALLYAKKSGLNPEQVLKSISSGAAGSWSLNNLVPRMIKEDFEPGFYVKHFIKDLKIALDSAKEMNLSTPGLKLALTLYEELADRGDEDSGTQALIKLFENM